MPRPTPADVPGKDDGAPGPVPARDGASAVPVTRPARSSVRRPSWVAPTATFVLGLLLGATAVSMIGEQEDGEAASTTAEPTATPAPSSPPTPPEDAAVTVPRSCLDVADRAEQLAVLVADAARAAGELDAAELSDIVRQMEESQVGLEAVAGQCRAGADPVPEVLR